MKQAVLNLHNSQPIKPQKTPATAIIRAGFNIIKSVLEMHRQAYKTAGLLPHYG